MSIPLILLHHISTSLDTPSISITLPSFSLLIILLYLFLLSPKFPSPPVLLLLFISFITLLFTSSNCLRKNPSHSSNFISLFNPFYFFLLLLIIVHTCSSILASSVTLSHFSFSCLFFSIFPLLPPIFLSFFQPLPPCP